MRKIVFGFIVLLILATAPLTLAQEASTKSTRGGEIVTIGKDEVIDRDYFVAGDTVNVYGTINGDLYAAGGQVIVDGIINGDVLAAGGDLNISGEVTQNVRVAGGNITIDGKIGRNLTVVGGNVDIANSAEIAGSIAAGAGNLTVSAPVTGNITAGIGSLIISNKVGGDVEAGVGQLTLTPSAEIAGDLTYFSDQEAQIEQGARVSGAIIKNDPGRRVREELDVSQTGLRRAWRGIGQTGKVISFLSSLVVGLLFLKLFPNYSQKVLEAFISHPAKSGLLGFTALILTPFAVALAAITIIGIPIAIILLVTYFIYLYLAKLFVVLWTGQYLLNRANSKQSAYMTYFLGLIAFTVITLLPIVGGIVKLLALLIGFGAMITTCKSSYLEARSKKIV